MSISSPRSSRHHEAGTIPPTVMWGACPTVFDPSQAPPGCTPRSCGKSCLTDCVATRATGTGSASTHGRTMLPVAASCAQSRRGRDLFLHAHAARHRTTFRTCARATCSSAHSPTVRSATPAVSRRRTLPNPSPRPLPVRIEQPSRRKRHRAAGLQRRANHSRRSRNCGRLGAAADRQAPCRDLRADLTRQGYSAAASASCPAMWRPTSGGLVSLGLLSNTIAPSNITHRRSESSISSSRSSLISSTAVPRLRASTIARGSRRGCEVQAEARVLRQSRPDSRTARARARRAGCCRRRDRRSARRATSS